MPPKKKIKSIKNKNIKGQSVPESNKGELSELNLENQPTRLSLLPVDVLLHIYKFLSPIDMVSLSQLGDPKFSELTDVQKEANFSVCRKASFELMSSYFSRERVKYIQKLNFSFCIFARPSDLVQLICRCKNLVVLSVIECGIQYKQMLKILENCSVLKELSWNIKEQLVEIKNFHDSEPKNFSVTKLYLFCDLSNNLCSVVSFIQKFSNIEIAIVCYSQAILINPPFVTSWSKSLSLSSNDQLRWITAIKTQIDVFDRAICQSTVNRNRILEPRNDDIFMFALYNHPPYLKVRTCEQDISLLSSCNANIYSSVVIFLTFDTFNVHEVFFNCISNIFGNKLKHLSIECEDSKRLRDASPEYKTNARMADMLGIIFPNCVNITVLNFGMIHFRQGCPFKAMCNLKNLKVLNIPTCAFPKSCLITNEEKQNNTTEDSDFEELISNCCKVEEFHLVCCATDKSSKQDTDLFPIQNWKKLKSFAIYSVTYKTCRFLRKIADSCPEFESFTLIEKAHNSGCIFYSDVIYLLKNAKNLSFIRINDKHFNPFFGCFMDALSSAKNLEGICFMTELSTYFSTSTFMKNLEPLKYLHLFHFTAPSVSNSLYVGVRKLMENNGIKNIKIGQNSEFPNNLFYELQTRAHELEGVDIFHLEPHFRCSHLHLEKFLFDFLPFF